MFTPTNNFLRQAGRRIIKASREVALGIASDSGKLRAKSADGQIIELSGNVGGQSLAGRLRQQMLERNKANAAAQTKKPRKQRRGT